MIEKIQNNPNNFKIQFLYYKRARDAIFDVVNELSERGYEDIYIPGYIGWSPKEGSGIFDPLNAIPNLKRHYYKMKRSLKVDLENLKKQLVDRSVVLVVNYFGFRDPRLTEIIDFVHNKDCIVIEDNAHGFYTYFCKGSTGADITVFSLHKMFPFTQGGGMIIEKGQFSQLHNLEEPVQFNPFRYNYNEIAKVRIENYRCLLSIAENFRDYFEPLRDAVFLGSNVPQTFPIIIKRGDRNSIYEIMNTAGYGVVSLYHTMIEELRTDEHSEALWLSKRIMNLPIHQDVDKVMYGQMIDKLIESCKNTR